MYMNLKTYFDLNFALCYLHKLSNLEDIENMVPWEREIYTIKLQSHLEQKEHSEAK